MMPGAAEPSKQNGGSPPEHATPIIDPLAWNN